MVTREVVPETQVKTASEGASATVAQAPQVVAAVAADAAAFHLPAAQAVHAPAASLFSLILQVAPKAVAAVKARVTNNNFVIFI